MPFGCSVGIVLPFSPAPYTRLTEYKVESYDSCMSKLDKSELTEQNRTYKDSPLQRNLVVGAIPIACLNEVVGEHFGKIVNNRSSLGFQVSDLNDVHNDLLLVDI